MKLYRYLAMICVLGLACILTVGCEKMEKPMMDAMDMAMTDTEMDTETETTTETGDTDTPTETDTPAETDMTAETDTPAETDMTAEMDDPDATISISPTEIASPEVGEQFTLTVNIDSKEPMAAYQFDLNFDATALKFVEHSISNYLSENDADITDSSLDHSMPDDGSLSIGAFSLTSTGIGEGIIATITFEVLEKKASTIVLSDVSVNRPDVSRLDVAINADTVVISE